MRKVKTKKIKTIEERIKESPDIQYLKNFKLTRKGKRELINLYEILIDIPNIELT